MSDPASGPKIFLSHRKEDRKTAELIRKVLRDLGFPESDIFDFTGGEETDRISSGSPVTKEIAQACHDSSLFILIYTVKGERWDYCLFEAGLALNARQLGSGEASDTRLIVFQCANHVPEALRDDLTVTLEEQGLRDFLQDLTTKHGFIPGHAPRHPDPSLAWNTTIESMANQLHNDLTAIIEARDANYIDVWRWDWLKLRLDADAEEQLTRSMKRLQAERREKLAAGEARPSELV